MPRAWWNRTALSVAAAFAAAPALAGEPSELACPVAALSAGDKAAITAMLITRTGDLAATRRAGDEAVSSCGARFEWNEREADAAKGYMAASLMQAHHRATLAAAGIDVEALERDVAADDQLVAAAAMAVQGLPPEAERLLVRRLTALAVRHRISAALGEALGAFVFSTSFLVSEGRRFATP